MPLRVNGVEITEEHIREEMQYYPAASLGEARRMARDALIIRTLLLAEARNLNTPMPEPFIDAGGKLVEAPEEAFIRGLVDSAVCAREPSEEECRAYYAQNASRFKSRDLLQASHILFEADPGNNAEMAEAKARAEETLARLSQDGSRFEQFARELSACPSGQHGGVIGQVTRGSTSPEFETILFALEPGQISPVPIRTRYGYHIARLDRRLAGRPLPYESVQQRIRAYLAERNWRKAVHGYIGRLMAAATIEEAGPDPEAARCGSSCNCGRAMGAEL